MDSSVAGLRPGEFVTVQLPMSADATSWDLPLAALGHDGNQAYVFVRGAGGFEARPVKVVGSAGQRVFCGYGLSLVMFVLALRHLGTARTGAYFSAAPFVGAVISLVMLTEAPGPVFWIAAVLMGGGIWLHISESHGHEHEHLPLEHTHQHTHDAHHQHEHDFDWDGKEPHGHAHRHAPTKHAHPHYPDIHHRHDH